MFLATAKSVDSKTAAPKNPTGLLAIKTYAHVRLKIPTGFSKGLHASKEGCERDPSGYERFAHWSLWADSSQKSSFSLHFTYYLPTYTNAAATKEVY